MSFLNISTPGFSMCIDENTGTPNFSLTAKLITPHALPYLPAWKAGPAKKTSNSLSSKKLKSFSTASSSFDPIKLSPQINV